jgi:hypothetical protein
MSKRLLCEGWLDESATPDGENCVLPVTVSYVTQGQNVWFAQGAPTDLNESLDASITILDDYDALELEEATLTNGSTSKVPKGGVWTVEGIFQLSDTKNANKRVYPRKIWEKLIGNKKSKPQKSITERSMIGHLEHPSDGRTDGKEGAILVTNAELRENGEVWGKAELLNTPNGRILQEYTRHGVRWGVSSRGNGSVGTDGQVNEDFELNTWDAVMRPSTPGAYPKAIGTTEQVVTKPADTQESHRDSREDNTSLIEDVEVENRVLALVESDTDSLMQSERLALTSRLVKEQQAVTSGLGNGTIPQDKAVDLSTWLSNKLLSLSESTLDIVDDAIAEAINNDSVEQDLVATKTSQVIESLRAQIIDEVNESMTMREKVEKVGEAYKELLAHNGQMESNYTNQLTESERKLLGVTRQLELANEILTSVPSTEMVFEAVQDAIREEPNITPYKRVLECAKDVEMVAKLCESILESVATTSTPQLVEDVIDIDEARNTRYTLPQGDVVSEAIRDDKMSISELSPGAQLAARMLGK